MAEKKKKASNSSMRLDKFLVEMGKRKPQPDQGNGEKRTDPGKWTVIKATDGKIDLEKDVVLLDRTAGFLCTHRIFYVK